MSVGDRGGPSHTTQKSSGICPPGTHVRQNEVVCDRRALKYGNTYSRAKKYNYTTKLFPVASTSHTSAVADNLSRLENVLDDPLPIDDSFPDEQLAAINVANSTSWYAYYANYIVAKYLPPSFTYQQKK